LLAVGFVARRGCCVALSPRGSRPRFPGGRGMAVAMGDADSGLVASQPASASGRHGRKLLSLRASVESSSSDPRSRIAKRSDSGSKL
jgi:hypothetical protein